MIAENMPNGVAYESIVNILECFEKEDLTILDYQALSDVYAKYFANSRIAYKEVTHK